MSKMKWDADGGRVSVRDTGYQKTPSVACMRNDPVQAAGAGIELPDRFAQELRENDEEERDGPTAE